MTLYTCGSKERGGWWHWRGSEREGVRERKTERIGSKEKLIVHRNGYV